MGGVVLQAKIGEGREDGKGWSHARTRRGSGELGMGGAGAGKELDEYVEGKMRRTDYGQV